MTTSLRLLASAGGSALAAAGLACASGASAAETGHGGGDGVAVTVTLGKDADFIKSLQLPAGTQARVWAQGPLAANPVAIAVDGRNRVYAAETMRFRVGGVLDIREHLHLYRDDLRAKTTADRRALYEKFKDKYRPDFFTRFSERVVRFEDSAQAGVADKTTVFADGFNDALDGPASGVLVGENGTVYLACVPKIWALIDTKGAGVADQRGVVSEGYGPRVSISGHDLHGLVWGPDGRLYWSMGDRGYNVTGKEGQQFADPVGGGVFRANPDGSGLELVFSGLRNPEELAFDEYGDLFSVDNNADIGDSSRVVYVMEGGTAGWSHGWQLLTNGAFSKQAGLEGPQPNPWLVEGLWKQRYAEQPAWVLPPIGYCTAGPCGLARVPATGWPAEWQGRFLVADYRAGNDSGVRWFTVKGQGAGFTVDAQDKFIWGTTITDVEFGYDGRLYASNYLGGWSQADKGRILALWRPEALQNREVAAVATLFATGFAQRSVAELGHLLAHADQRVRQAAQFELVRRGAEGQAALLAAAAKGPGTLVRLHGIWGIGQGAGRSPALLAPLLALLGDADARVRENAAKVLGDRRHAPAAPALVGLLRDAEPRVQAAAAIALGRIRHPAAAPALLQVLAANDDRDAFLRHAAVMGLVGCATGDLLAAHVGDASRAVRMGVLLAMRRLGDARLAGFLKDADPLLWAEAVRAIYDVPIKDAMPALIAALPAGVDARIPDAHAKLLYLRLINAAYRYGDTGAAAKLAEFAATAAPPEEVRALALKTLAKWEQPTSVDPVIGLVRRVPKHEQPLDGAALKGPILRIVARGEEKLLPTAVVLAQQLGYGLDEGVLLSILDNAAMAESVRVAAISQLADRASAKLLERAPKLLADDSGAVRCAAFDALVKLRPAQAVPTAQAVLADAGGATSRAAQVVVARSDGEWAELPMGAPALGAACDGSAANGAAATWVERFAKPFKDAGAVGAGLPRLLDDGLPANDDDIARNVWFDGGEARMVVDLGKAVEVARINTYSWHKAERAIQQFTLWGAAGDTLPDPAADDPAKGWTRLAKVDTSALGEGGKHGSSVLNPTGALGRFRWVMWQTQSRPAGTFFSKLCVLAQGRALPGLVQVATSRSDGEWDDLSMRGPVLGAGADSSAANGAVATWVEHFAKPFAKAGAVGATLPRLNDDRLARNQDDIERNVWFDGGAYRFVLDLKKPLEVARINTYSWHKGNRAPQDFVLWGAGGAASASNAASPEAGAADPAKAGWTRIARVDTWPLGEGGKHGSSVLSAGGTLGTFRWLMWQNADHKFGTFFSKVEVFAKDRPLPPIAGTPGTALIQLKQHAVQALGKSDDPAAAALLGDWLGRLVAGKVPPQLALELTEAAAASKDAGVAARLAEYRASFTPGDALAPYRMALYGGDAERGRDVFRYHNAQCMRCHAVDGDGGVVGPDLRGVPNRIGREAILESLIVPNAVIAPGYGTGTIALKDGTSLSGGIVSQDAEKLVVRLADGKQVTVPADKVDHLTPPVSAMPPMGEAMSRAELRDLIAYLASLK